MLKLSVSNIDGTMMNTIGSSNARSVNYYIGVALALGCAISGALKPMVIKHLGSMFETLALVFFTGIGCAATVVLAGFIDVGEKDILEKMGETNFVTWSIVTLISAMGILGFFPFAASLKFISATLCCVLGTIEIVLAYICQGLVSPMLCWKLFQKLKYIFPVFM